MRRVFLAFGVFTMVAMVSCSHGSSSAPATPPAPRSGGAGAAAAPAPAAPPQAPPVAGRGGAGGAPPAAGGPPGGGPPGAGGRAQLTPEQRAARRDSIAGNRTATVTALLAQYAGKENTRAGDVFKSLTLMQDSTVAAVLKTMDQEFGRGLSRDCTGCHAAGGDYAAETNPRKRTARIMLEMVNAINSTHLSKLARGGNSPTISCVTCHRGNGGNPGRAIMP